jgi:hypothetical protein
MGKGQTNAWAGVSVTSVPLGRRPGDCGIALCDCRARVVLALSPTAPLDGQEILIIVNSCEIRGRGRQGRGGSVVGRGAGWATTGGGSGGHRGPSGGFGCGLSGAIHDTRDVRELYFHRHHLSDN